MANCIKNELLHKEAIDADLLLIYGAVAKHYDKGEILFKEGSHPRFYYQIVKGKIKIANEDEEGKQFIQGFYVDGETFGLPPIFDDSDYPADAIAEEDSTVIRLSVSAFLHLLQNNFDIHLNITKLIAKRLKQKADVLKERCLQSPEQRIIALLERQKREKQTSAPDLQKVKIDYTRKHIADMTNLRVETVIRTMRSLYRRKVINIERGKVFY